MFVCNKCKRVFPALEGSGMHMKYRFCYGSKHDNDVFDLSICNECADAMADEIEKLCQISPIVEFGEPEDYGCGCGCDDCDDCDMPPELAEGTGLYS